MKYYKISGSKQGPTRREALQFLTVAGAAIAISERTTFPAHAESMFTIASGGGSWGEGLQAAFIDAPAFVQKFGVTPNYLHLVDAQRVTQLLTLPNDPPYSVAENQEIEHLRAADAGVLQDYDLDIVTNYKDIWPQARFAPRAGLTDWCASYMFGAVVLTYNTKHASKPASWEDMWNPKYKGRIAIPEFGWFGLNFMHAINKHLGGKEDDLNPAADALAALIRENEAIVMKSTDQANQAFSSEEILMMPFYTGRTFALQEAGVPVDMVYVPQTVPLVNGFHIPKQARFTELANRFVNNTLDGELQLEISRRFKYSPTNMNVRFPPELEKYKLNPAAADNVAKLDWQKVNQGRSQALDLWNRKVLGA